MFPAAGHPDRRNFQFDLKFQGSGKDQLMITKSGAKAFERLQLVTQAETLDLLVQGLRQVEIAHRRNISSETIKQHLQRARRVLQARNTCALVATVVQYGWIVLDEEPDLQFGGSARDWLPYP